MKKILFNLLLLANAFAVNAQLKEVDVYNAKEMIFYGNDFSHFKLSDPAQLAKDDKIKKYIPTWMNWRYLTTERMVTDIFRKEKVSLNFSYTYGLIRSISEDNLVVSHKHVLPKEKLQGILNKYQLDEGEGVGFVIIHECFDKSTRYSTAYYTFFDIATKKIIFADYHSKEKSEGYGLTNHWGFSIYESFRNYALVVYNKRKKTYFKNLKKKK